MESATSLLNEFQKHYSHGIRVPRQQDFKWKSPTATMMWKTNFDRAMFSESDQAGIGVVVRNQVGQVMSALSKKNTKTHFN